MISREKVKQIHCMSLAGIATRRIARECGISRQTVETVINHKDRYLRARPDKPRSILPPRRRANDLPTRCSEGHLHVGPVCYTCFVRRGSGMLCYRH